MANKRTANGAKLLIKLHGETTFTQIKKLVTFDLPDQSFESVEAPGIEQENGVAERIKTVNRAGGDFTANIEVKDAADPGLLKLAEAYQDTDEYPIAEQPILRIQYNDGTTADCQGNVTQMKRASASKNALLAYDIKMEVNAPVTFGTGA